MRHDAALKKTRYMVNSSVRVRNGSSSQSPGGTHLDSLRGDHVLRAVERHVLLHNLPHLLVHKPPHMQAVHNIPRHAEDERRHDDDGHHEGYGSAAPRRWHAPGAQRVLWVDGEALPAAAHVRPERVDAFLLALSCSEGALVDVCAVEAVAAEAIGTEALAAPKRVVAR